MATSHSYGNGGRNRLPRRRSPRVFVCSSLRSSTVRKTIQRRWRKIEAQRRKKAYSRRTSCPVRQRAGWRRDGASHDHDSTTAELGRCCRLHAVQSVCREEKRFENPSTRSTLPFIATNSPDCNDEYSTVPVHATSAQCAPITTAGKREAQSQWSRYLLSAA